APRSADPVRVGRGAADRDRDRAVDRADHADEVLELVELALVVERLGAGPDLARDVDVLGRPRVPLLFRQIVALARLLGVAAAGDEMDDRAPGAELVEGREGLG